MIIDATKYLPNMFYKATTQSVFSNEEKKKHTPLQFAKIINNFDTRQSAVLKIRVFVFFCNEKLGLQT